jgi:glycosyltransferase involved in cell wall biosynthesis
VAADRALRVLLVVNSLGFGGTERMIERLVRHLERSGRARFTVCSLAGRGPIGARLALDGTDVRAFGIGGGAARQIVLGAVAVRRLLRGGGFDLVHSFLYRSHAACRLARLEAGSRVPLVSSERCLGDNRGPFIRLLNRAMASLSDRVLAVSRAVAGAAVERDGVRPERVAVVPNGIEPEVADPRRRLRLRRGLGLSADDVLFLYLGRLHHEKGPDILLEALDRLHARAPRGWAAALVGDGPERPAVEAALRARPWRGRVLVAGARARVSPWLDAADVLVLPSREEGMPVAAIEAMMRGRPVAGTRVGGTPEVVRDGITGVLVPPGDADALGAALGELLRDPARRLAMGAESAAAARAGFTVERMAEATLHEYRTLLAPRGEGAAAAVAAARVD